MREFLNNFDDLESFMFYIDIHYENFTNGVFDVTGIVYFISVVAICLFLTMQSIQKRRWN